jgi:hypothetical protein
VSSGTRSLIDEAFFSRSLSFSSLVRCRRWCVDDVNDDSPSAGVLDLDDLWDLCWRWPSLESLSLSLSLSDFERTLLLRCSRGRSSQTSLGVSAAAVVVADAVVSTSRSLELMVVEVAARLGPTAISASAG